MILHLCEESGYTRGTQKSQGNWQELVLSFYYVGPGVLIPTWVIRVGHKHFSEMSHLAAFGHRISFNTVMEGGTGESQNKEFL